MTIDTVLFDMDGTLLDTLTDLQSSSNYAITRAGLPAVSREEVRAAAGHGLAVLLELLTKGALDSQSERFKNMFDEFQTHYLEHANDNTAPYPGVLRLLEQLKQRGIKMAVVSNKAQPAVEELRQLWFDEYLQLGVGLSDAMPKKPAPDMALYALEKLGSVPQRTLYVGDSEPDVQIAQNAGCHSVGVLWGFRSREQLLLHNPEHLIESPDELLAVIDEYGKA